MKRTIENNGVYLEIDADQLLGRLDEVKASQVLVVKKGRIELAGDEKKRFVDIMDQLDASLLSGSTSYSALTEGQKSDVLLRTMLVRPIKSE